MPEVAIAIGILAMFTVLSGVTLDAVSVALVGVLVYGVFLMIVGVCEGGE